MKRPLSTWRSFTPRCHRACCGGWSSCVSTLVPADLLNFILSPGAMAAGKPKASEYTLWDGTLAHFGVRVHPSGVKSFIDGRHEQ